MDAGKPESARRVTKRETPDYDGAFTPDGKRLALVTVAQSGTQGNLDVALVAAEGGEPKTIVGDVGGKLAHAEWPSPSPDGKRLAYTSTHEGNQEVYVAKIDGSDPVRLTQSPGVDAHPCWTPDGRSVVFATDRWGGLELAIVRDDATGLKRLTHSPGLDDYPAVSPDGKRLAFVSNREGNLEVYVSALDGAQPAEPLAQSRRGHDADLDARRARRDVRLVTLGRIRPLYRRGGAVDDHSPAGSAKATKASPAFVFSLPAPPAATTTYCRPPAS